MPNTTKIQRDDIIKVSINIVRESGMDKINARSIAKILNCSTQPIYYHFPTIEQLKSEVKRKIRDIYNSYILDSSRSGEEKLFKAVGIAYIKFAIKEPVFFRILFMDNINFDEGLNHSIDENYDYILSTITDTYDVSIEAAKIIYDNVWICTHGLAVMIATGFMKFSKEAIVNKLTDFFKGQLLIYKDYK